MSTPSNVAVYPVREGASEVIEVVDDYGFLSSRSANNTDVADTVILDTAASLTSSGSSWAAEALGAEERWWASAFLLYLSWKSASYRPAELIVEDADSSSVASSPACSCHHTHGRQQQQQETDAALVDRWFWSRWEARLRQYGGCPHMSLRGLLWGFFAGAWQQTAEAQHREATQYVMTLADPGPAWMLSNPNYAAALEAIDRDVGRTFPHHVLFHGALSRSAGQRQLRRLLGAYAARDPEVGYCQGMAFVAAVVLMVAPETQAYQIFCGLMRDGDGGTRHNQLGDRHGMRQLYRSGFPLLQTLLRELERHVESLLPALAAHLQSNEVQISMFASRWFLTLFVHQLPPPLLLRVWDFFLVRGWTVMVQVAVALLHQEQGELLKLDLEGVLLRLKSLRSRRQNGEELLRRLCSVPLL
ncbi:putative rab6 GTP-binding protein [Leptomonas pyrrhocoris]|uniref:Putative rab6 GTP-binding protein n=1 Tax=Leptomonas pyrrhocoris TaxID=157538 RepID=A0A0M9G5W6_LEPPY|nr:putative rab6 GTP-binding protein [Leptomonas pyrrhocoris]KPA83013.1 putative rab6 GTP-binding protein [Leptomonas pyrrhocoris]|eukprot:XP_015661452.1 putative rab6 GTP-binding protein [Leptomonas pyrrhocoris]